MAGMRVRLATYNVLSPQLCTASYFPHCPTSDSTTAGKRLERVKGKLEEEIGKNAVICLQEVARVWEGDLHELFANKDYHFITSSYGAFFNGYMGVAMAFPRSSFTLEECKIVRISETKAKGYRSPVRPPRPGPLASFVNWVGSQLNSLVNALRLALPFLASPPRRPFDLWREVERRQNTMIMLRLRPKGEDAQSFCVATYHMPCAFRTPQVIAVHSALLAKRLHKLAKGDPYFLTGDFNLQPDSSMYELLTNGKYLSEESARESHPMGWKPFPEDTWEIEFGHPLKSAYKEVHGAEPDFTNYAKNKDSPADEEGFIGTLDYLFYRSGDKNLVQATAADELPHRKTYKEKGIISLPSQDEPSDHIKVAADFLITPIAK